MSIRNLRRYNLLYVQSQNTSFRYLTGLNRIALNINNLLLYLLKLVEQLGTLYIVLNPSS